MSIACNKCLFLTQLADVSGRENHDQIQRWWHSFLKQAIVFSTCLLFAAPPAVELSIGELLWSLGQWVTWRNLWSHVLCVCVCRLLYLAHPNETCCCLRGETFDPIVYYWYRALAPIRCCRQLFHSLPTVQNPLAGSEIHLPLRQWSCVFTSSDIETAFNGPSHFSSQRHVRKSRSKAEKTARGECPRGAC